MTGSYVMVDPAGRFFDNTSGYHTYGRPILEGGRKRPHCRTCPLTRTSSGYGTVYTIGQERLSNRLARGNGAGQHVND